MRTRRHSSLIPLVAAVAFGLLAVAAPAGAAGKAPVKLKGKVNNEGTVEAKNGKARLEIENYYFNKTFVHVTDGTTVTLKLKNTGSVPHTFTVDSQAIDQTLSPGKSATVTLTVSPTEPVVFYCQFHQSRGMQGAVYQQAGATAKATKSNGGGSGSYDY